MTTSIPPDYLLVCGEPRTRLEIHFHRQGDRFAHDVSCVIGEDRHRLLQSVEGGPGDRAPASPPLQQTHRQQLPDGRHAIFAVGQAGRGHWSLVAACQADVPVVEFEVACRIRPSRSGQATNPGSALPSDAIVRLGMTYNATSEWQLSSDQMATCEVPGGRCRLEIAPGGDGGKLQMAEQQLRMEIEGCPECQQAVTRTWKYLIRLDSR